MANVVPVPSDVRIQENSRTTQVQFGEALIQGDFVYVSTVDNKAYKISNATEGTAYVTGVICSEGDADEYGFMFNGILQEIDLGVPAVVGELYVVSAVDGQIMPYEDMVAGEWICYAATGSANGLFQMFNNPLSLQKV